MTVDVLGLRALNRATLARQHLLERADLTVLDAVHHFVGLQAQVPRDPYLALWSRLAGFDPQVLSGLLVDREVVRAVVLRGTIHLLTGDDCLGLRPLMQPVLDGEMRRHSEFASHLDGLDLDPVVAFGRELLSERPHTGAQLRAAMAERFPELHPGALALACRNRLTLVQVPPRGLWGRSGAVSTMTAEAWLGRSASDPPSIDEVVLRYLGAFGPAAVADVATWSRLTGLRDVIDRLRPRLRVFRDERGRELVDLPDAPRPDPDTPAPVRFLPEYDNVLLSHADRSRFAPERPVAELAPLGDTRGKGTVLQDGHVVAHWALDRDEDSGAVVLDLGPTVRLPERAVAQVEREGLAAVRFLAPEATGHDVRTRRPA